ncbi:MAG: DUF2007 domain-containing protein [Clostridiales bacterium]|nr:DUF2007 domain-containing protein [Clostridiales bacterium]MCF8022134.1 DUF2007 domain-containing protein [Clostridiales bacterium]
MKFLFYLFIVIGIIIFLYFKRKDLRSWLPIFESNVEEVYSKYSFLKSNNIKCRVKGLYSLGNWGSGRNTTARLEVHEKDYAETRKLLNNNR